MTTSRSLEKHAEYLDRAQRHWQARREAQARGERRAPVVAVSREAGTSGTAIAREVGNRLNWPVYDQELLQHIARETGLRADLLKSVDERHKGWLTEAIESFAAVPQLSEAAYAHHLLQTILSLGAHGACVIVGRGAAQILPPDRALRVRLVGRIEDRVVAAAKHLGLSPQEARRWIEQTDHDRVRFIRDHFLKDPVPPDEYDLILSTSRWTIPECATLIIHAVRALEARMSPGAGA
ncbi:MAG: cytidylate kinase-like family protein [Gemmataceae bacterium]|nr:cytidylate kinase-like family protein [Gemmataceae bacterium]